MLKTKQIDTWKLFDSLYDTPNYILCNHKRIVVGISEKNRDSDYYRLFLLEKTLSLQRKQHVMSKQLEIRNSTAEFLIFQAEGKEDGIQVVYKDETIWCTQKAMAALFDVDRSVITKHLKNIFELNELNQDSVCAIFAHTAEDGKTYNTQFYNLDAIISVGYRVNSLRTIPIRLWPLCRKQHFTAWLQGNQKRAKRLTIKNKTLRVCIQRSLSKVFEGLFCSRSKIFSTFAPTTNNDSL